MKKKLFFIHILLCFKKREYYNAINQVEQHLIAKIGTKSFVCIGLQHEIDSRLTESCIERIFKIVEREQTTCFFSHFLCLLNHKKCIVFLANHIQAIRSLCFTFIPPYGSKRYFSFKSIQTERNSKVPLFCLFSFLFSMLNTLVSYSFTSHMTLIVFSQNGN